MSSYESFGFRYIIVGTRDGLYGVKNLDTLKISYMKTSEVINLSKREPVMGVSGDRISVEMFNGWIMKQWLVRKNDNDFAKKFGVMFIKNSHGRTVLCLVDNENKVNSMDFTRGERYNTWFLEFINSFVVIHYCNLTQLIPYKNPYAWGSNGRVFPSELYELVEVNGVGFNFITENEVYSLPSHLLTKVHFDKFGRDFDSVKVFVECDSDDKLSGQIKTSRPMELTTIGNYSNWFGKITTLGGTINWRFCGNEIRLLKEFLDGNSVIKECYKPSIKIADECILPYLVTCLTDKDLVNVQYGLLIDDSIRYRQCVLLNKRRNVYINELHSTFYVLPSDRKKKYKIYIKRSMFEKFSKESDFSQKHGVDFERFASMCEIGD